MSVDFTAIFDHHLRPLDFWALPDRLNTTWSLPPPLRDFVATYVRANRERWEWDLDSAYDNLEEEFSEKGYVYLQAPDGFIVAAYRQAIYVTHLARWWSFLHEHDVQQGLLLASRQIASVVHATQLLYLPDSAFPPSVAFDALDEGKSIESIVSMLRQEVSPPLDNPAAFLNTNFEDLSQREWFHEPVNAPSKVTA